MQIPVIFLQTFYNQIHEINGTKYHPASANKVSEQTGYDWLLARLMTTVFLSQWFSNEHMTSPSLVQLFH